MPRKKKENPQEVGAGKDIVRERALFDDVKNHKSASETFRKEHQDSWDEKEAILLGNLMDDLSVTTAKSQVYDPRLSTIVFERGARVMAQPAEGNCFAISQDDIGKNLMMDLIIKKWVYPNANYQMDFLIKDRLWDIYSNVYGVMFKLIGYVQDDKRKYYGPNDWLLPIRSCYPQPGKYTIEDADWFGVETKKSLEWIESRPKDGTWKNLDEIVTHLKNGGGKSDDSKSSDEKSKREQEMYPNVPVDPVFPEAEFYTEYRKGKWITIATDYDKVVREVKNPHNNWRIPIVPKHGFPLIDSIYGLGEIERGKTLQYAINSLINLYLDGVKMSLFPPIQINPNAPGLVPSTIKNEAAAKWLVGRPNIDVQQMQVTPRGMNTFQGTYSFLIAALLNQAGTSDTTVSAGTDPGMGKTPEAIKAITAREGSRDNWDRFMMERAIRERNMQFIEIIVEKLTKPIYVQLFKHEIDELKEKYKDVDELVEEYKSGRGSMKVTKNAIKAKYDYEVVPMSTVRRNPDDELKALTRTMEYVMKNPAILNIMSAQSKQFKRPEKQLDVEMMFRRWFELQRVQDKDRYFSEIKPPSADEMLASSGLEEPELVAMATEMKNQLGGNANIPVNP